MNLALCVLRFQLKIGTIPEPANIALVIRVANALRLGIKVSAEHLPFVRIILTVGWGKLGLIYFPVGEIYRAIGESTA